MTQTACPANGCTELPHAASRAHVAFAAHGEGWTVAVDRVPGQTWWINVAGDDIMTPSNARAFAAALSTAADRAAALRLEAAAA